jgi:hypothetical protein
MRAKGAATFTLSVQQIPGHRPDDFQQVGAGLWSSFRYD